MCLFYIETFKHIFTANERKHVPEKTRSTEAYVILGEENWTNIVKYHSSPASAWLFFGPSPPDRWKVKAAGTEILEKRMHWKFQTKQEVKMFTFPLLHCFFLSEIFLLEMQFATQHLRPLQAVLRFCLPHVSSADLSGCDDPRALPLLFFSHHL